MGPKDPFLATAMCYTPVHFLKYVNVNLLFWVFCCLEKEVMRKNWCRRTQQSDRQIVYGVMGRHATNWQEYKSIWRRVL